MLKVGDRVRAKLRLGQGPTEDLPAQHFCDKGDELIVRSVEPGIFPVYVSHEHITDRSFGVNMSEIEQIPAEGG
jgi:hypothetical protein